MGVVTQSIGSFLYLSGIIFNTREGWDKCFSHKNTPSQLSVSKKMANFA